MFACGTKQDELIPSHEIEQFAELLSSSRGSSDTGVVYNEMSSLYGHDAFFKELRWLVRHVIHCAPSCVAVRVLRVLILPRVYAGAETEGAV